MQRRENVKVMCVCTSHILIWQVYISKITISFESLKSPNVLLPPDTHTHPHPHMQIRKRSAVKADDEPKGDQFLGRGKGHGMYAG